MKEIVPISVDEIPMIQKLAREIWEEHYISIIGQSQIDYMLTKFYSTEKIKEEIEAGIFWEFLKVDEIPVGYLVCELEEKKLYLSKIYLKSTIRGMGLGRFLIERAIELAKIHHKKSIYLNVNKYNVKSIEFYQKNGFKKIDEGVFDIGNGFVMDDFIMELRLK